tara:strand:- start:34 stop:237 length:204 start_codon:yes stop_codon:yes gene_type:complete
MKIAIGVNSPKNIKPITIGFTIIPSRIPKFIHSLFSGRSISAFTMVMARKIIEKIINEYDNTKEDLT